MGTVFPVVRTIIARPRHGTYVVLGHIVEFIISGFSYGTGFRQSPTFRTNRASSFVAVVTHIGSSAGSGGGVGVIDAVSVIGGFRLVAGTDGFIVFRISVPRDSSLAGGSISRAVWGPVLRYVAICWF